MHNYTSKFSSQITDMINFKTSMGYKERSYIALQDFDRFCAERYPEEEHLTEEIVSAWGTLKDTERVNGLKKRLIAVRQFGKYLNFRGIHAYVLPTELIGSYEPFYPYIFTDEELQAFFKAADSVPPDKRSPFSEYTIPTLFRLLYSCGLRPNEVRDLRKCDVNVKENSIFILDSKGRKDRIISITEEVSQLCKKYDTLAEFSYPNRELFFKIPACINGRTVWIENQLHLCWKMAEISSFPDKHPRVYDFRHNYATRIMMRWMEEGENVMSLLPFLSAYMGHASFSSTAYYIHLLPERLIHNKSFDWSRFEKLIPEVTTE